jgi:hypothetical protein
VTLDPEQCLLCESYDPGRYCDDIAIIRSFPDTMNYLSKEVIDG